MGYYLTESLVHDIADDLATEIETVVEPGLVVSVIVADLSYRADWEEDRATEKAGADSPLVLLERTYGDGSVDAQAAAEEMVETGLLMMDREGVSLDVLFANLQQNIEAGDLFPSSEAAGLVLGHLAIAVAGLDRDTNGQIMTRFQEGILQAITVALTEDDKTSDSYYVAAGSEDEEISATSPS